MVISSGIVYPFEDVNTSAFFVVPKTRTLKISSADVKGCRPGKQREDMSVPGKILRRLRHLSGGAPSSLGGGQHKHAMRV